MHRAKRAAKKSQAKRAGPPRARRLRAPNCGGLPGQLGPRGDLLGLPPGPPVASWTPPGAS
eukprot:4920374-Pyramimonas_sp.AAC.1